MEALKSNVARHLEVLAQGVPPDEQIDVYLYKVHDIVETYQMFIDGVETNSEEEALENARAIIAQVEEMQARHII